MILIRTLLFIEKRPLVRKFWRAITVTDTVVQLAIAIQDSEFVVLLRKDGVL
jgi:hypothetical protein